MAHPPLTVRGRYFVVEQGASETPLLREVGSAEWFAWLEKVNAFFFTDPLCPFTARKQRRSGRWYWYAQRWQQGRLHSIYLGRTSDLTLERLRAVAGTFQAQEAPAGPAAGAQKRGGALQVGQRREKGLSPLLASRLVLPHMRPTWVLRRRAGEYLQKVLEHPLTLVCAPHGFGKTTLLAQWAALSSAQVAWVSLEESERDPRQFWACVLAALDRLVPGARRQAWKAEADLAFPQHLAQTALARATEGSKLPVLLMLDNYHVLQEAEASLHEGVAFLVEHLPPQAHVVLAGRRDPPLPLARLRAHGGLYELRAAELGFTAEETAEFLTKQMGAPLAAQDVAALHLRTEGWVVGLQLAAQALKGEENLSSAIASFSGEHPYIGAFVSEEVLKKLPDALQRFLLETSVLRQLNGALCAAVTGGGQSQELLETLAQAGLFLLPVDDQPHTYRFHPLFAEALQLRLRQSQPERVAELRLRASAWYEAQGNLAEAMVYAFAAGDLVRAAWLLEAKVKGLLGAGALAELQRWMQRLPLAEPFPLASRSLEALSLEALLAAFQREQASWKAAPESNQAVSGTGISPAVPGLGTSPAAGAAQRHRKRPLTAGAPLVEPLSKREQEILRLLGQGAANKEIARRLGIALATVKRHLSNIYAKLGAHRRTEALVIAQSLRLIEGIGPE